MTHHFENGWTILFCLFIFIFQKIRKNRGGRGTQSKRQTMNINEWASLSSQNWTGLHLGARNSTHISHTGVRGPGTWAINYCFPLCISRKLCPKWSSLECKHYFNTACTHLSKLLNSLGHNVRHFCLTFYISSNNVWSSNFLLLKIMNYYTYS